MGVLTELPSYRICTDKGRFDINPAFDINSCVGIDGAIRKAAMLFSVCLLMATDVIMHINMLGMVPEKYIQIMGIQKLGICEFFCLLFILYEAVSILKNMTLCGLPVPARIKKWIQKFLEDMTEELPEDAESK